MTAASELWDAVTARYDSSGLVTLTNIRDRSATAIDDAVGEVAAQSVIDLWPLYAQVDYDQTNATHVEVAVFGVIAVLWRRGGAASSIEQVKWDTVFGPDGAIAKVKMTGPRGRAHPVSNSGVRTSSERTSSGEDVLGWSDAANLPPNYAPRTTPADAE